MADVELPSMLVIEKSPEMPGVAPGVCVYH